MGVDPKRPLVGFALVAVLCAVLMALSVGRGSSFDVFQPGKPIASSMGSDLGRVPAPAREVPEPAEGVVPAELSTQPLAAPTQAPVSTAVTTKPRARTKPVRTAAASSELLVVDATSDRTTAPADRAARQQARHEAHDRRAAERHAARAEHRAEKAAAKAERRAAKDAAKAERRAAKDAAKDERHAAKAAEKAERHAAKAAEKAERRAEHAEAKAARDAEKAAEKEKAGRKG